ncbi:MAG: AAA family ATPase [Armatimonadetes bacterium CG17_big_fil_post_rev_8_21_14_2_50_66_6]|nr:ATP-binding protein [Armatimonadota bacterium]PIU94179.1 MAG: AAA family ATPase [Armatimonadetes bacterium CG06_land_8_20_14_3_00_66_21]PIW12978.1 MAG: AAA family ATPase [Armatimonadetes bacterium CG17_big_fil_post_rev_8_21_14_2_50_66_6]
MATRPNFDQIRAMLAQNKGEEDEPVDDAAGQLGSGKTPVIPPAPGSIRETGLNETFLENLLVKMLFRRGQLTLGQCCVELRLPFPGVVEDTYLALKREMLLEVKGGNDLSTVGLRVALTNEGMSRAKTVLEREGYVGPAPVPLDAYKQQLANQPVKWSQVTDESMRQALGDVVVSEATLEKLGPAFNSGRSMFLFGNPGNGKTLISERMARALRGRMLIPYAIEVGGQVVQYFDGSYHTPVPSAMERKRLDEGGSPPIDTRWIVIERPFLIVGGELKLAHLDLTLDPSLMYYTAPVQLKANGGVLMIDDFGRQQVSPRDLLNRWIVPLEKRLDYHTLPTGLQVAMPFEVLVIFSTNMEPKDLVDEAFLRRIRYKIEIGDPTEDDFRRIFRTCCGQVGLAYDQEMLDYLVDRHYFQENRPFRAVHPRDLLSQLVDIANYTGQETRLTRDLLDRAVATYFVAL